MVPLQSSGSAQESFELVECPARDCWQADLQSLDTGIDLSGIDFEALKTRFKQGRKHTEAERGSTTWSGFSG